MTSKPHTLGTVLPDHRTFERHDKWHHEAMQRAAETASANTLLRNARTEKVSGETRYYVSPTKYAVVSLRSGRILWFETRAEGDFSVTR